MPAASPPPLPSPPTVCPFQKDASSVNSYWKQHIAGQDNWEADFGYLPSSTIN